MKRLYWLLLATVLVWQGGGQIWRLFDPKVYIVFCNVGQGDATLIYQGAIQVLVDAGPNDAVLDCLSAHLPWLDRRLELVVNTHPERDHLGGLPEVLHRYRVGTLVVNGLANDNLAWREVLELVSLAEVKVYRPGIGDRLVLGDLVFTVLWPPATEQIPAGPVRLDSLLSSKIDLNTLSVVLNFDYGPFNLLLTGDIGAKEELALIERGLLTETDVLKVPHHGSKFSSSANFLEKIKPSLAVIEVGASNRFGHPTAGVLMRLDAVRARIFRTDRDGEIRLVTDGQQYWQW